MPTLTTTFILIMAFRDRFNLHGWHGSRRRSIRSCRFAKKTDEEMTVHGAVINEDGGRSYRVSSKVTLSDSQGWFQPVGQDTIFWKAILTILMKENVCASLAHVGPKWEKERFIEVHHWHVKTFSSYSCLRFSRACRQHLSRIRPFLRKNVLSLFFRTIYSSE